MKKSYLIIALGLLILVSGTVYGIFFEKFTLHKTTGVIRPTAPIKEIKVAFIGDQGLGTTSRAVLQLIKDEGADIVLHQGDFDYKDNPDAWDKQYSDALGKNFPVLSTIGNHEMKLKDAYEKKIKDRIALNKDITCTGILGEKASCIYNNLFLVSTAPGLIDDNYAEFIEESFSKKKDFWNICLWHYTENKFQVGGKKEQPGINLYDTCRQAGAMIVTAHEHSYHRTYLLDNVLTPHVVSTSTTLALSAGKTFVVVSGAGGHSLRPQIKKDPWWSSIYTTTQKATFGALFCTFNVKGNPRKADCYFKDVSGKVPDRFTITR